MSKVRAEILPSLIANKAAARISITASREKIFDLLANPRSHQLFDGSGTIKAVITGPERLSKGSTFSMSMKIKVPYRIKNTVVACEENKLISWSHLMKWTWTYELLDQPEGTVEVIETFDASAVPPYSRWWLKKTGAMDHNPKWIAKSLVELKRVCEDGSKQG